MAFLTLSALATLGMKATGFLRALVRLISLPHLYFSQILMLAELIHAIEMPPAPMMPLRQSASSVHATLATKEMARLASVFLSLRIFF